MIDLLIIAAVVLWGTLGYFTGLFHRAVGVIGVYLAFLAATATGPTAANLVLQGASNTTVADAIVIGYFLVFALILIVIEVLAAFYHSRLKVTALLFDKATGAIIGAVTGLAVASVVIELLLGAATPTQGSPTGNEIVMKDQILHSALAPELARTVGKVAVVLFSPVIPENPGAYFSGQVLRNSQ